MTTKKKKCNIAVLSSLRQQPFIHCLEFFPSVKLKSRSSGLENVTSIRIGGEWWMDDILILGEPTFQRQPLT